MIFLLLGLSVGEMTLREERFSLTLFMVLLGGIVYDKSG